MPMNGDFQAFTAAESPSGKLVAWNAAKAFGYLESGGKRVFLPIKEFEKRPGWLSVGDEFQFSFPPAAARGRAAG